MTLESLVREFAENVAAQTDAIFQVGTDPEDKHGGRYIAAFDELRARGNEGREALCILLKHPRMDVRVAAASFLLRYRTAEAKAVLDEVAQRKGFFAFEAGQALKRWEEGTWALDPE
ncbi:hypothetical protein EJ065_0785 [Corallococcus coralloides]|uniref:DUF2019 domain-containing protein n=1 Tax=Corallococcus coralloides TaxID=184914 RepID=A0A410RKF6_CORCK|nr:DUF2019 domain-containing protein [Corallococcus coralloides]QAT82390.1 hypothetical protein EJ065_0785 [Corallococcus coralloides]RYZ17636.1 MAG: DUF2019 domain-containing protein [Myxococcaceae bacterium]